MAQQMPNPIELYEAAAQGFRKALSGVRADQMSNPTPCTEWNVQALINHNIKVTGFVHGALLENITVNPTDVVGVPLPAEGSVAALDAGVARVLELVKSAGSAEKHIETPFGHMTRGEFLMAPFLDLLVHTWDLAKGTGQNTTLDSGLVGVCYAAFEPQMDGMRSVDGGDGKHIIGPAVPVPASAGTLDKLIGMMGRQT
jgi:uncharacterized protein (TIGR03086 family)